TTLFRSQQAGDGARAYRFRCCTLARVQTLRRVLSDFVNSADVGMVQRGGSAGFASEAFQRLRVVGNIIRQEFQSDKTAEFEILGLINHNHPTAAELLDDAVVRDGLASHWAEMLGVGLEQVNEDGKYATLSSPRK